jgi:hypothetical protein
LGGQGTLDRDFNVKACGVEPRYSAVFAPPQQHDFGAAEYDALRPGAINRAIASQ